jgi:rubrerythrin
MSIVQSLLRLFDPIAYRLQQAEKRRKADTKQSAENPDQPPRNELRLMCRICGYEGTGEYCPRCLAATMEKPRRR